MVTGTHSKVLAITIFPSIHRFIIRGSKSFGTVPHLITFGPLLVPIHLHLLDLLILILLRRIYTGCSVTSKGNMAGSMVVLEVVA